MAIEFVLDDKGNPQKDAETGLYLMKRNDKTEPLDLEKLFQGIAESNRDAAAKRKALESVTADLADAKAALEAMKDEVAKLKGSGGDKKDGAPPQESEEMRLIRQLQADVKREREEKAALKAEQEKREIDRMIEEEFSSSAFAAEHGHIPLDFWLARYRSHCAYEEYNGQKMLLFKDSNGNVILSEKTPGVPAKRDEALSILCANRPKPGDIRLDPARRGGAGTQQPQRNFANSNPWAKGQENITMQHQIMAEDPALAQRLAASAGVQLPVF